MPTYMPTYIHTCLHDPRNKLTRQIEQINPMTPGKKICLFSIFFGGGNRPDEYQNRMFHERECLSVLTDYIFEPYKHTLWPNENLKNRVV